MLQRSDTHIYKSDIPVYLDVVKTFRAWSVQYDGKTPWLYSYVKLCRWPYQKELVAECDRPEKHPSPEVSCDCGIYGSKYYDPRYYDSSVFGIVKLWGRIIEHEYGYRSQYAYPESFIVWCYKCSSKENLKAIFYQGDSFLTILCFDCWNKRLEEINCILIQEKDVKVLSQFEIQEIISKLHSLYNVPEFVYTKESIKL